MDEQPYTQLTDIESLVGKTVDRVERYGGIVLVFADRTFARISIDKHWERCDDEVVVDDEPMGGTGRRACKIATVEEVDAHEAAERERSRRLEADIVARRREEYERLKAEFEDKP